MRRVLDGGYVLDDARSRLDLDAVWAYLGGDAYWDRFRDRTAVERQLAAAWRAVGLYAPDGTQVGLARADSDGDGLGWLADVYVLPEHAGRGLGRSLVEEVVARGDGARTRWLLQTRDAHGFYARLGFRPAALALLERPASLA